MCIRDSRWLTHRTPVAVPSPTPRLVRAAVWLTIRSVPAPSPMVQAPTSFAKKSSLTESSVQDRPVRPILFRNLTTCAKHHRVLRLMMMCLARNPTADRLQDRLEVMSGLQPVEHPSVANHEPILRPANLHTPAQAVSSQLRPERRTNVRTQFAMRPHHRRQAVHRREVLETISTRNPCSELIHRPELSRRVHRDTCEPRHRRHRPTAGAPVCESRAVRLPKFLLESR